jgi:hypothetical protein
MTPHTFLDNGIKRPIRLLLEAQCYPAALTLIYSGIEIMSFLNLPPQRSDVMRSDFILWSELYLTPLIQPRVKGKDLYGARCSVLRGADSRLVREGHCRMIRYRATPEDAIVISVEALAHAFFLATDTFLKDQLQDERNVAILSKRLEKIQKVLPF